MLWAFALALVLPILAVAAVRFINPPITPLMLLRQAEARMTGQHSKERHYAWIDYATVPHDFWQCVLTSEDQRFFAHHGFDWKEIEASRERAARTGKPARGASTITMQCARSLFLWQDRSWIRKGLEAYFTFWMETLLSKRRILELYVNVIEMGDGVYGLEAAARQHFGVAAAQLTREQCALLAAVLPNPRVWNPRSPGPQLARRQARLLLQAPHSTYPLPR